MCSDMGAGGPQKSWQDYVREDLASLRMPYDWFKLAPDFSIWRDKIHTAAHLAFDLESEQQD